MARRMGANVVLGILMKIKPPEELEKPIRDVRAQTEPRAAAALFVGARNLPATWQSCAPDERLSNVEVHVLTGIARMNTA